jgi:hypothetical protein
LWDFNEKAAARSVRGEREALADLLEKLCGRAALRMRAIEGHAGACLGLRLYGGMTDDFGRDKGWGWEGEFVVAGLRDCRRKGGASWLDGRKVCSRRCGGLHLSDAVMGAVPSAACGEICFRAFRDGEQGQNQREAEEEKQSEAESASHRSIVCDADERSVRELLFVPAPA